MMPNDFIIQFWHVTDFGETSNGHDILNDILYYLKHTINIFRLYKIVFIEIKCNNYCN